MSDEFSNQEFAGLEGELRQFKPGVAAGELQSRLARRLAADAADTATGQRSELSSFVFRLSSFVDRLSPADRCLAGAMGLGLAACLVIVGMLGMDLLEQRRGTVPVGTYAEAPAMVQTREFLAQLAAGHDTRLPAATAPN